MSVVIGDDLLANVARVLGGEEAVQIIMFLKNNREATDDQILMDTGLKLNDIRRILFKLYNHSIVQCDRLRDDETGWFIFRWKLKTDQIEGFVTNQKKRVSRILKMRLEYEESNDFFYCFTLGCNRYTFEDAMELIFRCPKYGKPLQHYENSSIIESLKERINAIDKIDK